jgi:carboxyl-terminal processing protease
LRGHLSTENGEEEETGSVAYVPPEAKDDAQLQFALDLLNGLQVNAKFPPNPEEGVPN